MLPVLPPHFENKQTYTYGQLTIELSSFRDSQIKIARIQPCFFGSKKHAVKSRSQGQSAVFKYNVATNLWHFYAYLSDCRSIPLVITDSRSLTYACEIPITLLPSSKVLSGANKNIDFLFQNNGYLLQTRQKLKIYDNNNRMVSTIQAQLFLSFDEDINRVLFSAGVLNFGDLLIIDEISPILSSIELQNFTQRKEEWPQIGHNIPQQINQTVFKIPKQSNGNPLSNNLQKQKTNNQIDFLQSDSPKIAQNAVPTVTKNATATIPKNFEQDQKMVENDIDRLIAEMQNRPYDSSRYVQPQNPSQKKENFNFANTSPLQVYSSQKRPIKTSQPPKHPSSIRATSVKDSLSPLKANPIYSYSAIPTQSDRVNYLMNHTSYINREKKASVEKCTNKATSRQKNQISAQKGTIRLKIHELMMQRYEQDLSLILKCYLNDDSDQYYTANGIKQGEIISFSSNLAINEQREIQVLRFTLIDSYDMTSIFASGEFEMQRLYALRPTKGVFTVNMRTNHAQRNSSRSKIVNVEQSRLVKVAPNLKTLRIELQYSQQIEILQIYFSLCNFNKAIKTCRYKVPMTKETIEFNTNQLSSNKHVNIFPHCRSPQNKVQEKIILELWGAEQLLGISEISLKQLQNTNQKIIASSLEPIYLYDQDRSVQSIKGGKTNNMFHLQLYYGTVCQVQGLLNQTPRRQPPQRSNRKHVQVQQMLGVYVKQRKTQRQVQIQVSQNEMRGQATEPQRVLSKKASLGLQQQQEMLDQEQCQELKGQQNHNQFLNKSLQQKYLGNQTIPMFTKIQNKGQDFNFKKTQQSNTQEMKKTAKPLKSLTGNFQQLIKQNLDNFSKQDNLKQLKAKVKDHLLYNFIEIDLLKRILQELGVSNKVSNVLLHEVAGHSNGMINVNVLYDMIYGLMLDGFVKEKYIDDAQLGKYCLSQLYAALQSQQQRHLQEFLIDDSAEYEEVKKVFQKIGYKVTMRQFNQMELYTKKAKQSSKLTEQQIKQNLLRKVKSLQEQEKSKENYQKVVLNKLYRAQWDQDDDFFISNINQDKEASNGSIKTSDRPIRFCNENTALNTSQHALTVAASNLEIFSRDNKISLKPDSYQQAESFRKAQPSEIAVQKNPLNFRLSVQGFQNCIQTAECHLNVQLNSPKLRIIYKRQNEQCEVLLKKQQKSIQMRLQRQKEYLDGSIELINDNNTIAKCNYSIIVEVRSVYTLKSINQGQFCGLLYIRFSSL